jgi:hypothetical protein
VKLGIKEKDAWKEKFIFSLRLGSFPIFYFFGGKEQRRERVGNCYFDITSNRKNKAFIMLYYLKSILEEFTKNILP